MTDLGAIRRRLEEEYVTHQRTVLDAEVGVVVNTEGFDKEQALADLADLIGEVERLRNVIRRDADFNNARLALLERKDAALKDVRIAAAGTDAFGDIDRIATEALEGTPE